MDDIDALIRGASVGILLPVAILFLWTLRKTRLGWIGFAFALGAICYQLWSHPQIAAWPIPLRLVIGILSLSTTFFFWALARCIFEDEFRLRPAHWAVLAVIIIAGIGQAILPGIRFPWLPEVLRIGFRLVSLMLLGQVFWLVWRDLPADLVEGRARFRVIFLAGIGVVAVLNVLAALLYAPAPERPAPLRLAEAIAFLVLNLGFAIALLRPNRDVLALDIPPDLPPETAPGRAEPASSDAAPNAPQTATDPGDDPEAGLLARLEGIMREGQVWQEAGLTVGGLATRAGIPEYRLRRLINQRLGFRNFTAFLNEYRLTAAAARLADRDEVRIPVLTVALDLGFGSIGPFNRAFRARFNMTPTDYRRKQTDGA